MAKMRVAMAVNGTRGDFQPYLSLAVRLRQAGHETSFFTGTSHCKMAEEFNFEAEASAGDMEEFLRGDICKKAMEKGDFAICATGAKKIWSFDDPEEAKTRLTGRLKEFKPNMFIYNAIGGTNIGEMVAELYPDIPRLQIELQPQCIPSNKWKNTAFQRGLPDKDTPNVVTFLWTISSSGDVEEWRDYLAKDPPKEEVFKIMNTRFTPERMFDYVFEPDMWTVPRFLAYSPSFWPNEPDWPKSDKIKVLGNFKLSKEFQDEWTAKGSKYFSVGSDYEKCIEFIDRVGPPVYIGWGSMVVYTKQHMTLLAVEAVKQAGVKAIILAGWAQLGPEGLDGAPNEEELRAWCAENVLFIKAAPHELLFPKCKAAVHHGGIGTLQASLSCGCPTIITPVFADQFDNAAHLEEIQCGTSTTKLGKLKAKELGKAIKTICEETKYQANAKALSDRMLAEDGVGSMMAWLEKFFTEEAQTGKYQESLNKEKEHYYELRKKNAKMDYAKLQARWGAVVQKRFPAYQAWTMQNMKFMAIAADLAGKGLLWTITGTSVLARQGEGLKTEEAGRFRKFAFLEQVGKDAKGTRLHMKRLRGRGPEEGWITATVKGKEVARQVTNPMEIGAIQMEEMNELFKDVMDAMAEEEGGGD